MKPHTRGCALRASPLAIILSPLWGLCLNLSGSDLGEILSSILLIPIHLDALCLETDLSVVEPKCDFTRLPYWDGSREVNPDIANISEELRSRPFQDRGLQLRAGVHLHWALPDALTRGENRPGKTGAARKLTFPAVPNRWLVTRSRKGGDEKQVIEGLDRCGFGSQSSFRIAIPSGNFVRERPQTPDQSSGAGEDTETGRSMRPLLRVQTACGERSGFALSALQRTGEVLPA